ERGGGGNRTRVKGFADLCLCHSATPPERTILTEDHSRAAAKTLVRTVARGGADRSHTSPVSGLDRYSRRFDRIPRGALDDRPGVGCRGCRARTAPARGRRGGRVGTWRPRRGRRLRARRGHL